MSDLDVTLEFGGGAELLVRKLKRHEIKLPSAAAGDNGWTIGKLLVWIRENLLKERPELFLKDAAATCDVIDVRPGILVLVNDADWELVGLTSYQIESGDNITFISTLHGG